MVNIMLDVTKKQRLQEGLEKGITIFQKKKKKKCQYIHEQLKTFVSIKKKSWLNLENIVLKCGKTSCENYVIQIVYNCF